MGIVIESTPCGQLKSRFSHDFVCLRRDSGDVKAPSHKERVPPYVSTFLALESCNLNIYDYKHLIINTIIVSILADPRIFYGSQIQEVLL